MQTNRYHFIGFFLLFFILAGSVNLFGQAKEIFTFEPDDTIETIRAKIKHNGYCFKVNNNWVFAMKPEQKQRFFSRHQPRSIRESRSADEIGPLVRYLGKQAPPAKFDWRYYYDNDSGTTRSYIGSIRDQGNCGSCYAFGAVAAAEGTYNFSMSLYDENCADFSEAFLAFCLSDYYSGFDGCDGADYDYDELQALVERGINNESDYLYTDVEQSCSAPAWNTARKSFASWHRITCGDIDAIKSAISTYGVVDVAVYVTGAFQAYSEGVYEDANKTCPSSPCYYTPTNHAVALVGWDDNPPEGGGGCWILRNSWGTSWGENGYMRIRYTSARVACEATYFVPGHWPDVTTGSADSITSASAILNGVVNPLGLSTLYRFQYGTSAISGPLTINTGAGSGSTNVAATTSISGLEPNILYHYRLIANQAYGADQSFTTQAVSPVVQTNDADRVGSTSARLNGTINPRNANTTYYFQYSGTTDYGSFTSVVSAGSGNSGVSVHVVISGLTTVATYHYRIVATNAAGTNYGSDKEFTTSAGSPGGSGGGSDGGGCFITSAAYGSSVKRQYKIIKELGQLYRKVIPPDMVWRRIFGYVDRLGRV